MGGALQARTSVLSGEKDRLGCVGASTMSKISFGGVLWESVRQ